jgi:hypothetical protein
MLFLLVWAGMAAWKAVEVDAAQVAAARAFRSWTTSLPPAAPWRRAWDELQAARLVDPSNPVTLELLGLLATRLADDRTVLAQAPDLFSRSLQLRPGSPRTWVNLAESKYLAGDTVASIEPALLVATRLGKAEPNVQRIVANYGLALWDEVAPSSRQAIDAAVAAGMRRNPLELLQIAERRGRLSVACRHVAAPPVRPDPKVSRICSSMETAR